MEKYQFKTNIMCNSCVAKVTPVMESHPEIVKWEVNLQSPDRTLTVEADSLSPDSIREIVAGAGYKAEVMA